MRQFTKDELITELHAIGGRGWVPSGRGKNDGAVGNTLEDLLDLTENNLPIPNASEWELKTQRASSSSLVTLCHVEPSPRTYRFVPRILLPNFGWAHKQAGKKYPRTERSFRMTISAENPSDRGFVVEIDRDERRISIAWDRSFVDSKHSAWSSEVVKRTGASGLSPQPYWGFDDLEHKMGSKLHNCFFVNARARKVRGKEEFWFYEAWMLSRFKFENYLKALRQGLAYVDFDARTGHNHGTKFRIKQREFVSLYAEKKLLFSLDN
jgi:hypothetical protein